MRAREWADLPILQTIAVGMDVGELRLLLMVAAYEARECTKESPMRIANTLIDVLKPKADLKLMRAAPKQETTK